MITKATSTLDLLTNIKYVIEYDLRINNNYAKQKNHLGTKFSDVSTSKHDEIGYTPSLIRRTLMNIAQKLDDEFAVDAGLLQIHKTLDYIRSLAKPSLISKIQLDITDDQG
ncbi:unnamed protein product [Rotaria magnacalcarata]|uniref:Uncharacterized protein n=2 Tax=Rotaria magnacalcarata TaxID=392030 RepID=A0A816U9Z6_9BILA|nr:unnamed protein product [Rotaria magnacalcarata]